MKSGCGLRKGAWPGLGPMHKHLVLVQFLAIEAVVPPGGMLEFCVWGGGDTLFPSRVGSWDMPT